MPVDDAVIERQPAISASTFERPRSPSTAEEAIRADAAPVPALATKAEVIQNLHCGHYELGVEATANDLRGGAAFDELNSMI